MPLNREEIARLGAGSAIAREVSSWPGVTAGPHRFGGVEFRVGRRELGHLHGDRLADLPFPRRIRDRLIAEGKVRQHRWVPDSGWVSRDIHSARDALDVVNLFRWQFERAQAKQAAGPPGSGSPGVEEE